MLANFEVAPDVLRPFVPEGTRLDLWQGKALVSLVGFQFLSTRIGGIPVPFHQSFEEVNLRFYVTRDAAGESYRRGVVFVRELVPRRLVAWVARWHYGENYSATPMTHRVETSGLEQRVEYRWKWAGRWNRLAASSGQPPLPSPRGSEAEFICEHYWGYTRQSVGHTLEYEIEHPCWDVRYARLDALEVAAGALYGPEFAAALARPPHSVLIAGGSPVTVYAGKRIS